MVSKKSGGRPTHFAWLAVATSVIVAAVTLAGLDSVPPGLHIDEVANALAARSLAETGRDLLGHRWPLFPCAFPDAERPLPVGSLWAYSAAPFARLGPGAWSARLPSVLWLWVAAAGLGWCALEVTRNRVVALFAGATAAFTPWLFVPGRVAWSIITFPALTALAVAALLRWCRTRRTATLVLSGFLFGLSIYSYAPAKLLVPLTTGAALVIFSISTEFRRRLWPLIPTLVVMALPLAFYLLGHPTSLTWRLGEESIWSDGAALLEIVRRFFANGAGYLSLDFLVLHGDPNLRHGTGHGQLLWIWAPLILMGIWQLWKRRAEPPVLFVMAGLLITPIGAAIMTSQPNSNRSVTGVVFWGIIAAVGCQALLEAKRRSRWILPGLVLLTVANIGVFLTDYFGDYRRRAFLSFDVGKGEILQEAMSRRGDRDLYVPELFHNDVRFGVFVPYWAGLPVADWLADGLDKYGILAWRGFAAPNSLVLLSHVREAGDGTVFDVLPHLPVPPGGRLIYAVEYSGQTLYSLHEY